MPFEYHLNEEKGEIAGGSDGGKKKQHKWWKNSDRTGTTITSINRQQSMGID